MFSPSSISAFSLLLAVPLAIPFLNNVSSRRTRRISHAQEYVLILGASSGVGRELALQYAARGARLCIVARREAELQKAHAECLAAASGKGGQVTMAVLDASDAEQMLSLRDKLEKEWGRLDTMLVVAGVSALRPLLEIAGVERDGTTRKFIPQDCTLDGLKEGVRIAGAAMQGNYFGPLVAALAFIPFMTRTSPSPSILQLSSVAAVVPPPTRALYGSSKSASLMLYQALAIEHPEIAFTNILPGTIEGDFRASAVDGGPVREADPNKHGLKKEFVARRCIDAVDARERTVFMGNQYRWAHLMYWIWPSVIERVARKKYNFEIR
ncbi:NAD-P-binding protein [Schizopora paradoxa]|uniref:NAD-P-binding protein n=1 Tax=Schizopora paradoxa TaxID=27342 RepID=A0A0H2SE80_9AGAM|nr:NAD-P-binding protein [Schizopora paradoxa]